MIKVSLAEVLTRLFTKYERVVEETFNNQETKVKTIKYLLSEPFVNVTTTIDELAPVATAANNPYSDNQKIQMGLGIVKNTNDFEVALLDWYQRPVADRTYDNFKDHFEEARDLLKEF